MKLMSPGLAGGRKTSRWRLRVDLFLTIFPMVCRVDKCGGGTQHGCMSTGSRDALRRLLTEPTVSVDDVARLLGVGRSTAYAAVNTGEIPVIRVRTRVRVPSGWVRQQLRIDTGPDVSASRVRSEGARRGGGSARGRRRVRRQFGAPGPAAGPAARDVNARYRLRRLRRGI